MLGDSFKGIFLNGCRLPLMLCCENVCVREGQYHFLKGACVARCGSGQALLPPGIVFRVFRELEPKVSLCSQMSCIPNLTHSGTIL